MDDFSYLQVARWLPFVVDHNEVENFIGDKLFYPQTIPESWRNLQLAQAFLCESLRQHREEVGETETTAADSLLIPPVITKLSPQNWQGVFLFLNSFEPEGIFSLSKKVNAEGEKIGTCLCLTGSPGTERVAAEIRGAFLTGKEKISLAPDRLFVIGAGEKDELTMSIKLFGLKLNGKTEVKIRVSGGNLGIIIDTRGRPLALPTPDKSGRERLEKWTQDIRGENENL